MLLTLRSRHPNTHEEVNFLSKLSRHAEVLIGHTQTWDSWSKPSGNGSERDFTNWPVQTQKNAMSGHPTQNFKLKQFSKCYFLFFT